MGIIPALCAWLLCQASFDPRRELEGFAACEASEFAPLYGLEEFRKAAERTLSPDDVAALRVRWQEEQARVATEIERIRTVPLERDLWAARRRIPAESPLGRARLRRFDQAAPFHVFVERGPQPDEAAERAFVDAYGPWLVELEKIWKTEFAGKLQLLPTERARVLPVYVLRSDQGYAAQFGAETAPVPYAPWVRFDATLGAVVTFAGPKQTEDKGFLRRALLHAAAQQILCAWSEKGRPSGALWFDVGLPQYLSAHRGLMPPALQAHALDVSALESLGGLVREQGGLDIFLPPLEELVALGDETQAAAHLRARAGGGAQAQGGGQKWATWYAQAHCGLLVWFLQQGEERKHRELFFELVDRALRGEVGLAVFQSALGRDLAPLERAFRGWLQRALWNETGLNLPIPVPPRAVALAALEPARRRIDLGELAPSTHDPESVLARELRAARRGAVEGAARRLRAALASMPAELQARCATEIERLEAFAGRRRAFFEALAATGARKLEFGAGAERLLAQVTSVDGRAVQLGENKKKRTELVLEELDLLELAEVMRDRKYAFEAGASAGYAFVLARDERWKKALAGSDPASVALRADAERDYPERFALLRALELLEGLAQGEVPEEEEAAVRVLASIGELVREHGTRPQVASRRATLTELARVALELRFPAEGLSTHLAAEVESLPGGRARLSYAFDSPDELRDWTQTGYMESLAFERPRVDFRVDAGRLVTTAFASLRHVLAFEGPQVLRCRFSYGEASGTHDPRFWFLLGMNDDGNLSFAGADSNGAVHVRDYSGNYMRESSAGPGIHLGETYQLELRFDGQTYDSRLNGRAGQSVPAGPRTRGNVVLFSTADFPLQIEELSIEGTPSPASSAAWRSLWVEERLRALGL